MTTYPPRTGAGSARLTLACVLAGLVAATTTACAAANEGDKSNGASDGATTISVAYSQPLQTLDPVRADQNQTNTVVDILYDTLTAYDTSNELTGSLASDFALTPDATGITVTLRAGVKFHDGTTLTAADVKYSFDRYVAVGQGISSLLSNYKDIAVTDDTHLTIELKRADALFLAQLAKLPIMEKSLVEKNAGNDEGQAWLQTHDAGSGPYELTSGTVPVKVARFAGYWAFDAKRPAAINFQEIAESSTKAAKLKSGQVDIALSLQTPEADALKGSDGLTIDWEDVPNTAFMFMNTQYGGTKDVRVRKALSLAYDYDAALKTIRGGHGKVENGPLPQTLPCLAATPPFHQDLAQAKQLFQQAGVSKLTLRFQPSISDQVKEATLLQSDLKSIGVTLTLTPITFPDYLSLLSNPKNIPELTLIQDTAPLPDSGVYLVKAYASSNIGTTNRAAYANATVDSLLAKAETTTDDAARCDLYKQVQSQVNADVPGIDMYTLQAPVAYRTGLTGVTPSQTVYPISLRTVRVS